MSTFRPPLVCLVYALTAIAWLVTLTCMVPIVVAGRLRHRYLEVRQP
jgi:hypothetical protein